MLGSGSRGAGTCNIALWLAKAPSRAIRFAMAASLVAAGPVAAGTRIEADTIFVNGNIITMTQPNARAQALAVRDGKIAAVGTNTEVEATGTRKTRRIDLKGRTVLPGLSLIHI